MFIGLGYGKESEEELQQIYDVYNEVLFNGELPSDTIVKWNNRTTKTIGKCSRVKEDTNIGELEIYTIELSKKHHRVNGKRELANTILHEMIHVKHFEDGHGELFQAEAERLNEITGLHIGTRGGEPGAKSYYRYVYVCKGCGIERTANVRVDNQYLCDNCGGSLKTIEDREEGI